MKSDHSHADKIVNFFFGLAMVICCLGMIYALIVFVTNCNYLRLSIDRLINNYYLFSNSQAIQNTYEIGVEDISENIHVNKFDQAAYVENLIEYAMKLQELEANSVSTNVLTFLYTFLSGTLIGVATYFTKKNYDSIKQIKENKELLVNLDSRTLFSNLYIYAQRTHYTMQIFSVSLDTIQDFDALSNFINKYVPKLNDFINEMWVLFNNNRDKVKILNSEEKKRLLNELYGIGNLIDNLHVSETGHPLITNDNDDSAKEMWKERLEEIANILKK